MDIRFVRRLKLPAIAFKGHEKNISTNPHLISFSDCDHKKKYKKTMKQLRFYLLLLEYTGLPSAVSHLTKSTLKMHYAKVVSS